MDRGTFIETLRRALYGKIDDFTLEDHIRYYDNYICQELEKGRSEKEILEELGDPRLIARTILDTSGARNEYMEEVLDHGETDQMDQKIVIHHMEGWKATLFTVLVTVAIILILFLLFRVAIAVLPFLIAVGAVIWLIRKIFY